MYENDVWSGLADFLANMIEKYAGEMDLDALPDPRQQSRLKGIEEVYRRYMRLSADRLHNNQADSVDVSMESAFFFIEKWTYIW